MHVKRSRGKTKEQYPVPLISTSRTFGRDFQPLEQALRSVERDAERLAQHGSVRIIRENFKDVGIKEHSAPDSL